MELGSAILQVLMSFVILALLLAGIGSALRSLLGLRTDNTAALSLSVWVGYGLTLFCLQIWHLVLPVNVIAFCFFGIIGLGGLVWNRTDLWNWLRSVATIGWAGFAIVGVWLAYVVLLADVATGPIRNVDTGIYQYSSVRWMATYAIVPGLANLNARLGFNNSSLLFPTLLDAGFWLRSAQHVTCGVLFVALAAQFASATYGVIIQKIPKSSDVFAIFVLGYALHHSYFDATAFSTDMPVFGLASIVFIQIIRVVRDEIEDTREKAFVVAAAIFLAAVAISAKLSICVFAGCAALIVLWTTRTTVAKDAFGRRMLLGSIGASVLCLIIWSVRGVIVTGYPFFPLTVGAMPVEWRVPKNTADVVHHWITCWARKPWAHWKETLGRSDWIPGWWKTEMLPDVWDFRVPIAVFILSLVATGVHFRGARRSPLWLLLIPNIASLIFWFLTAPGIRLGTGNFWILAATCAMLAAFLMEHSGRPRLTKAFCALGLVVSLAASMSFQWVITEPGPSGGFYPSPQIEYFKFPTDSGLTVLIPKNMNEPASWDSPLPTTPYPHRKLSLRRPGDLSSGFKVEPFDDSIVIGITP